MAYFTADVAVELRLAASLALDEVIAMLGRIELLSMNLWVWFFVFCKFCDLDRLLLRLAAIIFIYYSFSVDLLC